MCYSDWILIVFSLLLLVLNKMDLVTFADRFAMKHTEIKKSPTIQWNAPYPTGSEGPSCSSRDEETTRSAPVSEILRGLDPPTPVEPLSPSIKNDNHNRFFKLAVREVSGHIVPLMLERVPERFEEGEVHRPNWIQYDATDEEIEEKFGPHEGEYHPKEYAFDLERVDQNILSGSYALDDDKTPGLVPNEGERSLKTKVLPDMTMNCLALFHEGTSTYGGVLTPLLSVRQEYVPVLDTSYKFRENRFFDDAEFYLEWELHCVSQPLKDPVFVDRLGMPYPVMPIPSSDVDGVYRYLFVAPYPVDADYLGCIFQEFFDNPLYCCPVLPSLHRDSFIHAGIDLSLYAKTPNPLGMLERKGRKDYKRKGKKSNVARRLEFDRLDAEEDMDLSVQMCDDCGCNLENGSPHFIYCDINNF